MKHLKEYFDKFEASKLNHVFNKLYGDGWTVSGEDLVDSFGTKWDFIDIDHFVLFSRQTFNVIVEGYKIFLRLMENTYSSEESSENTQEKLESAISKIKLLEEQNDSLKKELCSKRTEIPTESSKASTKEYISFRRRKYVKIE